jgi:ubiquinone/menaquinone biosynthesis C-methylase UbiE
MNVSSITQQNVATYGTAASIAEYSREDGLRAIEAALVGEFFPHAPANVLDLGCGAARTSIGLARLGYRIIGIDLSEALLAEGRRRYPQLDLRLMDATRLAFRDQSFDAVLFSYNGIDCIYPLAERTCCIAEAFRVLKRGGVFLLSSHNLIGALFSGGYWYLRGYWNAVRLLGRQCGNRLAREWYIRYDAGGSVQYCYSAPPGHTVRQLEGAGFYLLHVRGFTGERGPRAIRMHEQHVYFVAGKRGDAGVARRSRDAGLSP